MTLVIIMTMKKSESDEDENDNEQDHDHVYDDDPDFDNGDNHNSANDDDNDNDISDDCLVHSFSLVLIVSLMDMVLYMDLSSGDDLRHFQVYPLGNPNGQLRHTRPTC